MVLLESAAVLAGLKGLFNYNRKSYEFNKTLDQERMYQQQKMRIEQVDLYREDLRDLFELTVRKMDNYYLMGTLMLGFSLGFYYEGKLPDFTPAWLLMIWSVTLCTAILFTFLSIWFSIHASVSAQTFQARMLTQWLRLPIPGPEQINAASACLEDYEREPATNIFRPPIVSSQNVGVKVKKPVEQIEKKDLSSSSPKARASYLYAQVAGVESPAYAAQGSNLGSDPALRTHSAERTSSSEAACYLDLPCTKDGKLMLSYDVYQEHFREYLALSHNWVTLDAYSRVALVVGSNQIVLSVIYTGLAYFLHCLYQWGTWAFVVLPLAFGVCNVYMNLLVSRSELIAYICLYVSGPLLAACVSTAGIALTLDAGNTTSSTASTLANIACPVIFLLHFAAIVKLLYYACWQVDSRTLLPTKFLTVAYVDVMGSLFDSASTLKVIATTIRSGGAITARMLHSLTSVRKGTKYSEETLEKIIPASEPVATGVLVDSLRQPTAIEATVESESAHTNSNNHSRSASIVSPPLTPGTPVIGINEAGLIFNSQEQYDRDPVSGTQPDSPAVDKPAIDENEATAETESDTATDRALGALNSSSGVRGENPLVAFRIAGATVALVWLLALGPPLYELISRKASGSWYNSFAPQQMCTATTLDF